MVFYSEKRDIYIDIFFITAKSIKVIDFQIFFYKKMLFFLLHNNNLFYIAFNLFKIPPQ